MPVFPVFWMEFLASERSEDPKITWSRNRNVALKIGALKFGLSEFHAWLSMAIHFFGESAFEKFIFC